SLILYKSVLHYPFLYYTVMHKFRTETLMNDHQLRSAILASAAYASRQKASTVGERSTCFLAALTGNIVLDAELSSALFTLMGVADKVNAPVYADSLRSMPKAAPPLEPIIPQPAANLDYGKEVSPPMWPITCLLAISFGALALSLFAN